MGFAEASVNGQGSMTIDPIRAQNCSRWTKVVRISPAMGDPGDAR
jgi:hypothetical protein